MLRMGMVMLAAVGALTACGTTPREDASSATSTPASGTSRRNACDLVDRAAIEAIAGIKLEMLHDIQEEDKTVCEMREPGNLTPLVSVTVYWKGGKQRANTFSDTMPSWLIKNDVLVELASPSFDEDKTKALFVSVSKTALPKL